MKVYRSLEYSSWVSFANTHHLHPPHLPFFCPSNPTSSLTSPHQNLSSLSVTPSSPRCSLFLFSLRSNFPLWWKWCVRVWFSLWLFVCSCFSFIHCLSGFTSEITRQMLPDVRIKLILCYFSEQKICASTVYIDNVLFLPGWQNAKSLDSWTINSVQNWIYPLLYYVLLTRVFWTL